MALDQSGAIAELKRMSRLLALLAIKDAETPAAIDMLSRAGYTYGEIGSLIGISSDAARMTLARKRKVELTKNRTRIAANADQT